MARVKRIVVPGYPHHIVQRGVRSMDVFFSDGDMKEYLRLLREQAERFGVRYISYCLMSNHIHLLAIPEQVDSLAKAVGEGHRQVTIVMKLIVIRWLKNLYSFQQLLTGTSFYRVR